MDVQPALALPNGLEVIGIEMRDTVFTITAVSTQMCPCCPLCGAPASRVHRGYGKDCFPGQPYVRLNNLFQRWEQGCHNIAQLFREVEARGYQGAYASVRDNIARRLPFGGRKASAASPAKPLLPTPRQAAMVFLRRPEKLSIQEQEMLVKLCHIDPEVALAYDLSQQLARMLRTRTAEHLDDWLTQVHKSQLPELQPFAVGIEKDKEAVKAGLTWWINNGMVEGQVTKLKID